MTALKVLMPAVAAAMSIAGFALMGADKRRAEKNRRRISEKSLFCVALLLGAVGTTAGMFAFRHKTKHWYFLLFMPLLAIADVAAIIAAELAVCGFI